MTQLNDLIAQKEALEKQIEAARKTELAGAIAEAKALIARHNLTVSDLFEAKKPGRPRGKVAPKYRNPETGETWTGRGRAPRWMAGKQKESFAI